MGERNDYQRGHDMMMGALGALLKVVGWCALGIWAIWAIVWAVENTAAFIADCEEVAFYGIGLAVFLAVFLTTFTTFFDGARGWVGDRRINQQVPDSTLYPALGSLAFLIVIFASAWLYVGSTPTSVLTKQERIWLIIGCALGDMAVLGWTVAGLFRLRRRGKDFAIVEIVNIFR